MKNQLSKFEQFLVNQLTPENQELVKGGGFVTIPLGGEPPYEFPNP